MPTQEKTPEEIAENLLANEERSHCVDTVLYKVEPEKLSKYSYQAIADVLNEFFGEIFVDVSDDGTIEKMFLDSSIGPFVTRDDEKVDILP